MQLCARKLLVTVNQLINNTVNQLSFEPRFWHPNRCLVPPTSSDNEQKWKGY